MKNLKLVTPKVEILGSFDSVTEAWKRSRPHLDGEDLQLHMVNDIDLPVHGMAVYAINVTGSVAIRELMFMLRPQSGAWAISDRTMDLKMHDLHLSEEVPEEYRRYSLDQFKYFIDQKEKFDVPQDLCKKFLPYGRMTNFTIICDKRTLANVLKGLRKGFPIIYEFYGKLFEKELPELLNTPGGDWLLNSLNVNEKDLNALNSGNIKMGRQNLIGGKIQGVLLSQFIRKIYDTVYSDIINDIKDGSIYGKNQSAEYTTVMYLPDSSFAKMQSTRTCAFAMFDKEDNSSWSYVLPVEHMTAKEFAEQLPCGGCASKCAFRKEQLPRMIAGNNVDYKSKGEVNPPCAIQTGVPGTHTIRGLKFNSDSKIYNKWTEVLAYLQSENKLPLTEDGKEYLNNVNTYGFAETQDNEPERRKEWLSILNKVHA